MYDLDISGAFFGLVVFCVIIILGIIHGIPFVYGLYQDYTQKDTIVSNCSISGNNNMSFTTTGNCSITCQGNTLVVSCQGK